MPIRKWLRSTARRWHNKDEARKAPEKITGPFRRIQRGKLLASFPCFDFDHQCLLRGSRHHFPEHFGKLLRCFTEASSDPFVQESEQAIGIKAGLIGLCRCRFAFCGHDMTERIIDAGKLLCMVDCLQHRLDRGVEGEKVLHVLSRVAAAVPHAVLTSPLIPQKDQLEGQSLIPCFQNSGTTWSG